jgi:hypothetical protein
MGIGMHDVEYLSERGHIPTGGARILDIGSQNLFNVTPDLVERFQVRYRQALEGAARTKEIERISYFSTPRPGERTTYLSELFDLSPDIFYTSYDVCPALKTEIFDLNNEDLPSKYRGTFDLVLNCGTTEHVINQQNSFKVMHEAVAAGGVMFHQLPSIGWIDHGYYTYHAVFFDDLIKANRYELLDRWYTPERVMSLNPAEVDIRTATQPLKSRSADPDALQLDVQCFNMTVVLRKINDRPFSVGLELATSHSGLAESVQSKYAAS